MYRKDRVLEALRSLCEQRPTQGSVLRRYTGFSAEEVAELAEIDRTNASRDLNLLAQEGIIERIPGRPVLFSIKTTTQNHSGDTAQEDIAATRPASTNNHGAAQPPQATRQDTLPPLAEQEPEHPIGFRDIISARDVPAIAASIQQGAVVTNFETLIGHTEGLKVAVQQAKAAIIYPPRGLHTLLCGPSGVGKTTFARLMHAFALDLKALPANAPFVSFNCADYAGNPQLLMAHLFGVVRGAYTGADHDREGLVEQAHRGILFLDEVHRLPPEGQEMLFYLMDRERFRRLGDVKERQASLLLLAATTEDPTTALLPTFRRRIPMTITLPGMQERTMTERYELVRAFFTTECSSIGTNIHVSPQVLRALLLYDCPGNVGQLRTDVQLTCARAYLEYRTHSLSELNIHIDVLPEHIRRGLLRTADFHRVLEPVLHHLEATHVFTPTGLSLDSFPDSAQDLYDTISAELTVLRNSGFRADEIHKLLQLDIQQYFLRFANTVTQSRSETPSNLVDEHILTVCNAIVQDSQEQLNRTFPEKLALVLALHLASALERLAHGRPLVEPAIQSMRQAYPMEYAMAQSGLQRIRSELGVDLPESEANVLAILFANADTLLSTQQASVGIIVAAHGRGIATGLAELANTLVGVNSVSAIELTLEQSPEELLAQVEHCVHKMDQGSGVLLLVDFASLLSLGELVTQRTGIQTHTVAGVCAPLIVEALRRAQRTKHITLDQLVGSLTQFQATEKSASVISQSGPVYAPLNTPDDGKGTTQMALPAQGEQQSIARVILSVCLTGFGSATKLAELMEEHLPDLRQQNVEIICMDINLSGKTEADVQRLVGHRQVVAIVGTINPHLESYPFISLTEMLFGDGIARLRTLLGSTLIDPALLQPGSQQLLTASPPVFSKRSDLIREISYTLSQRLLFLNPIRALPLIERMIEMIEVEVGESFEIEVLAGLIVHLACVLERGIQPKGQFVSQVVRTCVEQQFARELTICRHAWHVLSTQIARQLPDEEAYNIVGILRQVDIFLLNPTA
ncbi:MAG TPA: sigma 54-interacting transcriptional regulator [Ktedonosporobacter sp.]|nr:sigma 54-interacting transcriptional regulator [Ktedonosporobacter sp.]